jgi:hypothetical protein
MRIYKSTIENFIESVCGETCVIELGIRHMLSKYFTLSHFLLVPSLSLRPRPLKLGLEFFGEIQDRYPWYPCVVITKVQIRRHSLKLRQFR